MKLSMMGWIMACLLLTACATNKAKVEMKEQNEKVAAINIRLGMAYLERKDIQRAKTKLLMALKQAPDLPEAWYAMGYFYEMTGDPNSAQQYYLKSVKLTPKRGDVLNNYGTYLCRHGQYRESINYFQKAIKDPGYLDVASAYENAGLCALKIPDKKLAKYYFSEALHQNADRTVSRAELAKLN